MEHSAFKQLFWGILLALLAPPLSFLGWARLKIDQVPDDMISYLNIKGIMPGDDTDWIVKIIFLLTALGLVIVTISLKRLSRIFEAFDAIRWIAAANAGIAFILAFGSREIVNQRPIGQVNRHAWFPLDLLHYLTTIILLIFICKFIISWCVQNDMDEIGGRILEKQNHYLAWFVAAMFLFCLGVLFPGFFAVTRWVLIPTGLLLAYLLAAAISDLCRLFEPKEEF